MAFVHGKDSVFKLDNSGGSLTDISTYINSVDFPETADVAETTTLGDGSKTYIVGLKDSTLSVAGLWDATPEGTSSGKIKYTGEAILTSYAQNSPVGDVVSYSADFQVSGAVTRGTH